MTKAELLSTYRSKCKELEMVRKQLEVCGTDGRPEPVKGVDYGSVRRNTNDPASASRQLYEGLKPIADALEKELEEMLPRVKEIISAVEDYKIRNMLNLYYCCGQDDAQISRLFFYSMRHINRLRHAALKALDG